MSRSKPEVRIFHNPRCSKSRETLALLEARGCEIEIVEYLKVPPDVDELASLCAMLGLKAHQLMRKGEPLFKEQFLDQQLSEDQCLAAMARHPILIERPIVVHKNRAVLGRPPQAALDLLQ
ncbi:MAG: arsenate reductase (glutaredoxin) [Leptospirales bacterium]|nr:arsenate reductase (glutaredoxin) [Leptospirales bacterium]